MTDEQIEKIKSEYTDKYVAVRVEKPELARFQHYVGQVKTVNRNGRALVQFDDFNKNTGWFDIDLDYLKVVDKPPQKENGPLRKKSGPPPKEEKKQAAEKPVEKEGATEADEKKLSLLELARQRGPAKGSEGAAEKE